MLIMLILGMLGLIGIVAGISFHLGYFRGPIVYWTTFSSGVYATAPLGLSLLFLSIGSQLPSLELRKTFLAIASVFSLFSIVLGLTMPQFLTPWWFRYLRKNYDDSFVIHILMKDAAKDYSGWKKRTSTQEGLAEWAKEVQQRTKLE